MTKGDRIRAAREEKGITQEELGRMCGTTKQTIFKYESGTVTNIPLDRLEKLAEILGVTPCFIMGWEEAQPKLPSNVIPFPPMNQVPLVGRIACGVPILAEENIEEYVDLPRHIRADFALTCQGESMINIGVHSGDIVYIRQQAEVENGQVAAVMVGDEEATLKRFYHNGDVVQLIAENSAVPPMVFVGEEAAQIHVLGLAVAYTHVIE